MYAIRSYYDAAELDQAIAVCPVEVDDEFDFHLTKRKAIYKSQDGQYPQLPVIDMAHCTRCGACEKVCKAIDLSQQEEIVPVEVGSVLMATGFSYNFV